MTDFSVINPEKFNNEIPRGPYIKIRRERVGCPHQEFWLSVGDELNVTDEAGQPVISFVLMEVKLTL